MKAALEAIRQKIVVELQEAHDMQTLENIRVKFLGKKGELTAILKQMGKLSAEERPVIGQMANEIRAFLEDRRNFSWNGLQYRHRPGGRAGLL